MERWFFEVFNSDDAIALKSDHVFTKEWKFDAAREVRYISVRTRKYGYKKYSNEHGYGREGRYRRNKLRRGASEATWLGKNII